MKDDDKTIEELEQKKAIPYNVSNGKTWRHVNS